MQNMERKREPGEKATPQFYTTEQVADMLHVHVKTVRELIKARKLRALKIGNEYRVTDDHIRQFIAENET